MKTIIYHKKSTIHVGKYIHTVPWMHGMEAHAFLGAQESSPRISENCWSVADRPQARRGQCPQWAMTVGCILAVRVCSIAEAVLQDIGLHIIICEYVSISENIVIWLFIIGEGCCGISQVHGIRHPVLQCSCFTIQRSIWNSQSRSYEDRRIESAQWRIYGHSTVAYSSLFMGFFEKSLVRTQRRWHPLRAHCSLPYDPRTRPGPVLAGSQHVSNGVANRKFRLDTQRSRQKHYVVLCTSRSRDKKNHPTFASAWVTHRNNG